MAREKAPVTAAVRFLREKKITFSDHLYTYEERGGTAVSARELGVDEHCVVKTLVLEDDQKRPLVVLMHGDRQVSTRELARIIGTRTVAPCSPETAHKHSGYLVGGTSPFGMKREMPFFIEETILPLEKVFVNGGKRGYLVGVSPEDIMRVLDPTVVKVAVLS
jgi:Cys-tRNA(Pro) deacylase